MEQAPRDAPDQGGLQPALTLEQHLFERAESFLQQGQLQHAQTMYSELLQSHPAHFDCLQRLGWIAAQSKDYALAVDYGCRAIEAKPQSALAYLDVGSAMFGLGQYQASLECLDAAISLDAKCAQAYNNRGLALKALKQPQAAEANFHKAIALDPTLAQAWLNLGTLERQLDRHEEALASYDQAIALQPGYAQAYFNRGNVLQDLGRLDEAIAHFDQALVLEPSMADVHWNKAVCLLMGGHYALAWPLYEWRWVNHQATAASPVDSLPVWDGSQSLAGKILLLQSEQGLGDTIQFCRYIPFLAAQGAKVVFEVDPPLAVLMKTVEGVGAIVLKGAPSDATKAAADYRVLLMSLPLHFGTTLNTIPSPEKYLGAPPAQLHRWSKRLEAMRNKRIGLVWRGSPNHQNDEKRSIPIETLLAALPTGFDYVSLQYQPSAQEQHVLAAHGILQVADDLSDFADTAALCTQLDLVISVDTSVAHLSGALGVPCWVLVAHSPDWRWLLGRKDCVWYRKTQIYRQPQAGRWDLALQEVAHDLQFPSALAATA